MARFIRVVASLLITVFCISYSLSLLLAKTLSKKRFKGGKFQFGLQFKRIQSVTLRKGMVAGTGSQQVTLYL